MEELKKQNKTDEKENDKNDNFIRVYNKKGELEISDKNKKTKNDVNDNKNNEIRYNKNSALDYPSEAYMGTRDHYTGRNMSENNRKCCHT